MKHKRFNMRKAVIILTFFSIAGLLFSQAAMQLLTSIESPFADDTFSWSWGANIKGNGDINGDGYNDIVLAGKPLGSVDGRREVQIYLGGSTLNTEPDYIIPDPSEAHPFSNFNTFAKAIAYNGDLNGDGYCDLVVSDCSYGWHEWGRVYVYFGGPDFDTTPDLILEGLDYGSQTETCGLNFGFNIDISGDFNGDGFNDLVVSSSHGNLCHYGQVDIFFGGPDFDAVSDWHYYGEMLEQFGYSLSVGDLNGDGFSDLATMSTNYNGGEEEHNQELKVFLGGYDFNNQVDASYEFEQDYTHTIMFMDGDINHDGFNDLVINSSMNKILYGNSDLSGGFENLILPIQESSPRYYVVSNDSTFVVNIKSDTNPYRMEYNLSSYYSEGQYINNYQFIYTPNPINGCGFGYSLGDVNNDGSIEILVTNRENNNVVFNIITTHFNPDSIDDVVNQPVIKLTASPNPFKSSAKLSYELKEPAKVSLSVYNLKGQLVATLDDGFKGSGQHSVIWDGKDSKARILPSGVYLIRLKLGERFFTSKKVTLWQ